MRSSWQKHKNKQNVQTEICSRYKLAAQLQWLSAAVSLSRLGRAQMMGDCLQNTAHCR